jgi:hypothetical protein
MTPGAGSTASLKKLLCNSNEGRSDVQTVHGFFLCFVGLKMNEARVVIESEAGLTKSD